MLRAPRGCKDRLPIDERAYGLVLSKLRNVTRLFGFEPMSTPIFERTETFAAISSDDDSGVSKEMYTFPDKGGSSMTLRPEGTASAMRAIVQAGLVPHGLPLRVSYQGPFFRYERPQKGRFRQFHQFGVEAVGESSFLSDVDLLTCGKRCLDEILPTSGEKPKLLVNCLGDAEARLAFSTALSAYLRGRDLSPDSQARLKSGRVLRILDSKSALDHQTLADAPAVIDFLSSESKERYAKVLEGLDANGVDFQVSPKLVRGLDYYDETIFEFVANDGLAVLSGGRYDGLAKRFGRKERVPSIGWACGIERLLDLAGTSEGRTSDGPPHVTVVPLVGDGADGAVFAKALDCARSIRALGVACVIHDASSAKKLKMKRVLKDASDSSHCVFVGAREVAGNTVSVRDMRTKKTTSVGALDSSCFHRV